MFYRTLKVERTATDEEIKNSFRQLALTLHPDRCGGSTDAFQQLQKAYEVLGDPKQRADYDAFLSKKREKMKGFVRPLPFEKEPEAKVSYRIGDDSLYTFETSPTKLRSCGLRHGDIISFNDEPGVFIGLAADNYLYWCRDGTDYACRLCSTESTMGLSSIKVIFRSNLSGGKVHVPSSNKMSTAGAKGKARTQAEKEASQSVLQKMKEELRRKERVRMLSVRIENIEAQEREAREEVEAFLWDDYLDFLSVMTVLAHCTKRQLRLPLTALCWMGYGKEECKKLGYPILLESDELAFERRAKTVERADAQNDEDDASNEENRGDASSSSSVYFQNSGSDGRDTKRDSLEDNGDDYDVDDDNGAHRTQSLEDGLSISPNERGRPSATFSSPKPKNPSRRPRSSVKTSSALPSQSVSPAAPVPFTLRGSAEDSGANANVSRNSSCLPATPKVVTKMMTLKSVPTVHVDVNTGANHVASPNVELAASTQTNYAETRRSFTSDSVNGPNASNEHSTVVHPHELEGSGTVTAGSPNGDTGGSFHTGNLTPTSTLPVDWKTKVDVPKLYVRPDGTDGGGSSTNVTPQNPHLEADGPVHHSRGGSFVAEKYIEQKKKNTMKSTPRYMQATKSAANRTTGTPLNNSLTPSPMLDDALAMNPTEQSPMAPLSLHSNYDSFSAEELFAQETEFMKEFKNKMKKRAGKNT